MKRQRERKKDKTMIAVQDKSYTYDWLGRLATETVDGVTTTYTYDEVGNLISKTTGGVTTTYTINEFDQVEKVEEGIVTLATYTYDISGNRISKSSYGTTTTYTYDGQNNLTAISSGESSITFTYDANGERLTKTVGTDVYKYYFDGVNLLFTKKNDEYNNRYVYANGAVFAAVGGAETFYWYATDVRGSTSSILKSDSTANHGVKRVRDFSYDAYGETSDSIQSSTDAEMDEIAFTGGVYDKETGLYYLMSRYYDPFSAQFVSEDSYRGDGERFWNLYMYCEGDPVNRTDRNGHLSEKKIKENYSFNKKNYKKTHFKQYIANQKAGIISEYRIGNTTTGPNGCGWIAIYNAMKSIGRFQYPYDIIKSLEENNSLLNNGKLGISPSGIAAYFSRKGIKTQYLSLGTYLNANAKNARCCIARVWHDNGGHYFMFKYSKANKRFEGYNIYNNEHGAVNMKTSITGFLKTGKVYRLASVLAIL